MALTDLIEESDPRLKKQCHKIYLPDDALAGEIDKLQNTLAEFRQLHGFGRAIAAPQIGIMKRLIAFDLGETPFVMINPSITDISDEKQQVWDDCLSLPHIIVRVQRACSLSVHYFDVDGNAIEWNDLPADLAELVQHETDHLDGILMTDRAYGEHAIQPVSQRDKLIGLR